MMDTILNLGLDDEAVKGLAERTANPRFAADSYRRLIQMYGEVVDGIDEHRFEQQLSALKVRRDAAQWQWRILRTYSKPTIAMVNGWCFGGAFVPLVACDLAIAADEATFGLSEINWGIPPGSVVSRALAETVGTRDALLYIMTGRTFDGVTAERMGLVNKSVPLAQLREEVAALAEELLQKNPVVLRAAKLGFKHSRLMSWDDANDYLYAKLEQSQFLDPEHGRERGLAQFLDDKTIRPGLDTYVREGDRAGQDR